jgi:hypothetical protein
VSPIVAATLAAFAAARPAAEGFVI